jgi:hypothetical protein
MRIDCGRPWNVKLIQNLLDRPPVAFRAASKLLSEREVVLRTPMDMA